eukprot:m.179303 g.179303  ORF g.179303 m.179303 type:complete len:276 (+) comp10458_c0_seq1:354-1181(+)
MGPQCLAHHLLCAQGKSIDQVAELISYVTELAEAMSGAGYMQECIPESIDLKRQLFAQLDALAEPSTILASSTSCIKPSLFSEGMKTRNRVIVAHPINPPHCIPLVELIPAPWTDDHVVATTRALMEEIGQSPVTAKKEMDGFIVNRLQYALLMEAWRLVEDGVASPEDVDKAVSQGLGLRWSFIGPFETIDLNANGVDDYCRRYGEGIARICETQSSVRDMKDTQTAADIDAAMRQHYSLEQLAERRAWRDRQLTGLALHKKAMAEAEAARRSD